MMTLYRSDDGQYFDTEHECRKHEFIKKLVPLIKSKYNISSSASMGTFAAVVAFDLYDEIGKLMQSTPESKWISNDNNQDEHHPSTLSSDQMIIMKLRSGGVKSGRACHWTAGWRSADNCPSDIVAYKIIEE